MTRVTASEVYARKLREDAHSLEHGLRTYGECEEDVRKAFDVLFAAIARISARDQLPT